jgi:hypothetical protein
MTQFNSSVSDVPHVPQSLIHPRARTDGLSLLSVLTSIFVPHGPHKPYTFTPFLCTQKTMTAGPSDDV